MSVAISWTIRLWFIWAAIVYLCVACAASKNVKFNIQTQLQQFGWLERQTQGQSLVYPLALSVTSVATCTSVALRGAHPLHPLLTKPEMSFCLRNKAQTAAHISLPAAINLCSFFSFLLPTLASFATWLLLGCSPRRISVFCLNALRILILNFFYERGYVVPLKKTAPQNGWQNGAALVNARCLLFTFNLITLLFPP